MVQLSLKGRCGQIVCLELRVLHGFIAVVWQSKQYCLGRRLDCGARTIGDGFVVVMAQAERPHDGEFGDALGRLPSVVDANVVFLSDWVTS